MTNQPPGASGAKKYLLRLSTIDLDDIKAASVRFDRTQADEFRIAVQLHNLRHRRAYADSEDGRKALKKLKIDPDREVADLDAHLAELTTLAYTLPCPQLEPEPEADTGPAWSLEPKPEK